MSEAPERIWAWETLNCNGKWTIAEGEGVEYARADRIEELEKELEYWRRDSAAGWDKCEEYRNEVERVVEAAFFAGFSEGCDGTWVEGDPTPAFKEYLAELKGEK